MTQQLREWYDKSHHMLFPFIVQKHNKRIGLQIDEAAHRMGENLCQLYIWQGVGNQNIQGAQKSKLLKYPLPNEEMGKWT
jgi:hypothetical protein